MAKKAEVNWNENKAGQARYNDEAYKMFYTRVMRGEKRLKGSLEKMSPSAFLKGVDDKNVDATIMVGRIKDGQKISLPVLDEIHGKKVGIDTAVACRELGVKEMPVLVCSRKKK